MTEVEPWLRGPVDGVIPELQPAAHALLFAREQLDSLLAPVTSEQLWQTPGGAASLGYHARHFANSIRRMLTYARGESLTAEQLAELAGEKTADPSLTPSEVLRTCHGAIDEAIAFIRVTSAAQLDEARRVGRKQLPSTVRGLIFEVVVHTARHIGQIATTARIVR